MKYARYLADFGYNPLVLTAHERDIVFHCDAAPLKELIGTSIFACPSSKPLLAKLFERVGAKPLSSIFLAIPDEQAISWSINAKREGLRIAREYGVDGIYTSVGPYSGVLLGCALKKRLKVPWVVDFRDPWTDNAASVWLTKLHYWLECWQERQALAKADAIIVVTPTMRKLLVGRYPDMADRIHIICNGFDSSEIPRVRTRQSQEQLCIGYAGRLADYGQATPEEILGGSKAWWLRNFGFRHGTPDFTTRSPYYLLQAIRALYNDHPETAGKIKLNFAGDFGSRNLEILRELGLEGILSKHGYLPHSQALQVLADSDVLFLPMESDRNGARSFNLSGKVFEYLGVGRPILALVPEGDLRDLIRRTNSGWCVDPTDVRGIKNLLLELVMRKSAGTLEREANVDCIVQFERRNLTRQLAELFDKLLPSALARPGAGTPISVLT